MTAKKALLTGIVAVVVIAVGANDVFATNVGAGANMSAIQAGVTGDGIINFDMTATLTMDADGTGVASITVANGVTGTIAFGASGTRKIIFADAAGAITLNGSGALTITGTDATAGFDFFTTASGRTLTITSSSADSLGDAVAANRIMIGRNNVLTFATGGGAANAANSVVVVNNTGGVPTLDINNAVTLTSLSISTSGEDLDIDIASGVTAVVTNAVTLAGDSILELISVTGGGAETLTLTGGLTLNGTSALRFTNDSGVANGAVTAGADGVAITVNGTSTIATLTPTNNTSITVAAGKALTVTNAVTVPAAKIVTFTGTNDASAETLTLSGGLTLNGAAAELNVIGDNTTAMVVAGTVTNGTADGSILDIDATTTLTGLTPTFSPTLEVAAGKTLTITNAVTVPAAKIVTFTGTNDASAETLVLTGGMTLNGAAAELNVTGDNTTAMVVTGAVATGTADGGILDIDATTTLSTLTPTFSVGVELAAGKTLTVANAVTVPAAKIVTVTGTNDASAETLALTGGMTLNGAAAELNISGDNTTAMVVSGAVATGTADGAILDIDATTTLTTLTPTFSSTIELAAGKTLTVTNAVTVPAGKIVTVTGTNDASAETLALTGGMTLNGAAAELNISGDNTTAMVVSGAVATGTADGAILDIDATTTLTTLTPTFNPMIELAAGKTLTVTNAVTVPAGKIVTLTGTNDASAETLALTAGMTLNGAAAELNVTGDNTTAMVVSGTITNGTADGSILDIDATTTLTGLTPTFSPTIELAAGKTLTVTNAVTVPAAKIVTLTGTNDASAETLVLTGGMTLNGSAAELNVTGDNTTAMVVSGTITNGTADGSILDIDATTTLTGLTPTFSPTIELAAGKTLTITNAVTVPAAKIVTLTGTNDASAETLVLTGGMTLNGSAAELNVTGDNTTAMVVSGTITNGTADGSILDIDATTTLTGLTPTFSPTIELAAGKTLTVTNAVTVPAAKIVTLTGTNDASAETLALTGGMTLNGSAAELNVTGDNTTAMVVSGTVTTGTAAGAILDLDATTTMTGLTPTFGANIEIAAGKTFTITNAVTVPASRIITFTGTNDASAETLVLTGGLTLSGAAAELNTTGDNTTAQAVTGTVTVAADGGVLDTDASTTITAVNMTTTAGDLTLQVASGKMLTTTIDVNANTLTISESGTVSTVQMDTAAGVLDVDENMSIGTLTNTANFVIDVASGKTLTSTVDIATRTLTLSGTGTISRVDATTGTIEDNGGTTIADLRATFGAAGTFTWTGTGSGTITTLANALPGAGDKLNKTGTGSLTIASGFTTSFANAAGVLLDIDGGTVVIGSPGSNDNITFNDDADEITVASGAALTTYGSFAVGAAGANVNLDAAVGSTVNLSSTGGAESFTGLANDDYNLLGTVNINGSNGDYTIADAFDYKFGSVNINTTGSLINNQPGGEMKFVAASTITLAGSGTLTINGQASGTPITLNTTSGTGKFTIDTNASTNFTLQNANLTNGTYTDDVNRPGACTFTFTNVTLSETINFTGDCSSGTTGGGTTPPPDDTTDDEPVDDTTDDEPTDDDVDEPVIDDGSDMPADTTPPDTTDTSDEPVIDGADGTGMATVNNDRVDVVIEGLEAGTSVKLDTDANGATRVTIGDESNPDLLVTLAGTQDGADVDVSVGPDGSQTLTVTEADGTPALSFNISGLGDNPEIQATIDEEGNQEVFLRDGAGASFSINLDSPPVGADVSFQSTDDGAVMVDVTDPTHERAGLAMETSNVFRSYGTTITYDDLPEGSETAHITPGYPGMDQDRAYGGSVTVSATGLQTMSVVKVELEYEGADITSTGVNESDLRVHRFNVATSEYEPAGSSDKGNVSPTGVAGDYGVQTANNTGWAEVTSLGRFALGVPKVVQETPTTTGTAQCAGGGLCGTLGMLTLPIGLLGLMGMKRTIRRY